MSGTEKSREELLREVESLKARLAELERTEQEHLQAEGALQASEIRFHSVMQTARDAIVMADIRGNITFWNQMAETIFGYSAGEALGKPLTILIPDRFHEAYREALEGFVATGRPSAIGRMVETVGRRKDGSEFPAIVSLSAWQANGEVFFTAIIRDATERRKMEQALSYERDLLAILMDSIPDGIYFKDTESRFTRINRAQAALLGIASPEEAIGRTDFDFFAPEFASEAYEDEQEIIRSGRPLIGKVEELRRMDGESLWISATKVPFRNEAGEIIGIVGISRDITALKRAEERLRESEARFRIIAESSLVGVYIVQDEVLLYINPALAQMFGYRPEEIIERLGPLDLVHPDDRDLVRRNIRRRIEGEIREIRYTFRGLHRNGGTIYCEVLGRRVEYRGRPAIIGTLIDITRRRQSEEELRYRDAILETLAYASEQLLLGEPDRVLPDLLARLGQASDVSRVYVFRNHTAPDGTLLASQVCEWTAPGHTPQANNPELQGIPYLEAGFGRWVEILGASEPLSGLVRDFPEPERAFLEAQGIRSLLVVPIFSEGEWWGFLGFDDCEKDRHWSSAEIGALRSVAGALGAAFTRQRISQAEQEQRALAEALADTAAAINSSLDLEEVLGLILENVERVVPHDTASIMLVESGVARVARCRGYRDPELEEEVMKLRFPISETPTLHHAAKTGEPLLIPNVADYPGWLHLTSQEPTRSYLGAPICVDGVTIGFLTLDSWEPDYFTPAHARRLQAFVDQAAVAIQNARLYQELEAYSSYLEQAVEERTTELQRSKERVEAILNNSPDAILLLGADGRIGTANPAFYRTFGYEVDEVYNHSLDSLVKADYAEAVRAALEALIEKHEVQRLEAVARCKGGETFDADIEMAPIKEGQKLVGIVCGLRDISSLKEVARMKEAFVSNVSHELRTPITSLKLNLRLLSLDPERQEVYLERLNREVERLNKIIEDLLRLSRLDQGHVQLHLEPVDLNVLAEQFLSDRSPLAESRGLALNLRKESDLPPVQADAGLLGQVLSIFLTNALNYTPAGGRVTISTQVRRMGGRQWVGLSVSDTGPGIPPEEQSHLFERFFRGKVGRDSGAPGTGLGLAIAREIVDLHRGRIEVDSEGVPGEGTTFTVWLPAEE
ncbi:MAG TPA: PAS domain S-box protein [Chloroflexi bacterium]|nr:PAS domain S-box protein [Chloroflexota bacterium]